jgi:hypothetical protein
VVDRKRNLLVALGAGSLLAPAERLAKATIEILKAATGFFVRECDQLHADLRAFIDEHTIDVIADRGPLHTGLVSPVRRVRRG